ESLPPTIGRPFYQSFLVFYIEPLPPSIGLRHLKTGKNRDRYHATIKRPEPFQQLSFFISTSSTDVSTAQDCVQGYQRIELFRGLQGFLKEHRNKYMDNQKGLDQTIPAISPLTGVTCAWIISGSGAYELNLSSYWQEVLIKSLQETLHMFDESGKFYGKQLRLPYQEDATSSGDIRDNTLDSDLIPPREP
ncbi:5228_t:CDS:2, partial [Funneliformis geosporum]